MCNLAYDLTRTYIPVYLVFRLLTIIAAVLFQYVITLAYRDKKALTVTQ